MKHSSRNLFIIGGGLLQIPLIKTAGEMNLNTIVADMNPNAPGFEFASKKVVMSTKDIEGMVREAKKIARKTPIHGVITAGTDASMTVAAVANSLSLPGIRYVDAEAATNKVKMRKRLKEHSVPIPEFAPVWGIQDARDALEFLHFPLVIKPADNMGARGVIKVNNREELHFAFRHAKQYCPTGEMILEEYMEGPEVSVDALAWNGNIRITGLADRIIEKEPYFIETGHNMPSSLPQDIQDEIERVMKAGMNALGIRIGAGKGDIKITKDGVKVGEIAARLSGGFMSAFTYPLSTGVNLNRGAIQIALGEEPDDLEPKYKKVSIERSLLAEPGKLVAVHGITEAKKIDGVYEIFLQNKLGDVIHPPTNNIEKSGHIIIQADTLEKAEEIFQKANTIIRFQTDDYFTINEKEINQNARNRFGKNICRVCKVCDGKDCASGVPGMGGVGRMESFRDNYVALKEYYILPHYIRTSVQATIAYSFFNENLSLPVMTAPLTGVATNMNGVMDEYEFALTMLRACNEAGSIAWLGDGASPDRYLEILRAVEDSGSKAVLICKPREDEGLLRERFSAASKLGSVIALGMDIDAIHFKTMELRKQKAVSRSVKELTSIRKMTQLPFILKGILSAEDALLALESGADAIVVSNHGGRVLDGLPGTARALGAIKEAVGDRIRILVDGGVRSGMDAFKMIALGAEAVLVGRPAAIHLVGGGISGVKFLLNQYKEELYNTMNLVGAENLNKIDRKYLLRSL